MVIEYFGVSKQGSTRTLAFSYSVIITIPFVEGGDWMIGAYIMSELALAATIVVSVFVYFWVTE